MSVARVPPDHLGHTHRAKEPLCQLDLDLQARYLGRQQPRAWGAGLGLTRWGAKL